VASCPSPDRGRFRLLRRTHLNPDPLAHCIQNISGLSQIIEGLTFAFHGCVYIGAYIATGGAIQLTLTLAPTSELFESEMRNKVITADSPQGTVTITWDDAGLLRSLDIS
jgi:hypothetical protein